MEPLSVEGRCDMSFIVRIMRDKQEMITWHQLNELKNICGDSRSCWQLLASISSRRTVRSCDWQKKSLSFDCSKLHWVHQKNVQSQVTATLFRQFVRTQLTTCIRQLLKSLRPWSTWSMMLSSQVQDTLRVSTELHFTREWTKSNLLINYAILRCKVLLLIQDILKISRRLQSIPRILMQTHKTGE